MKFLKFKSQKETNINVGKYLVDWDKIVSKPQKNTKDFLFPFWRYDVVLEEFMIPGSRLRVDLINCSKRIAVEVSPDSTHKNFNKFMHKSRASGYLKTFKSDLDKEQWLLDNGFAYVKLTDKELKNLDKNEIEQQFNIIL